MVIVLTISESEDQIISGFPEYVVLTTNTPATIYYTLDGTDPDTGSDIFVDQLYLPTTGLSFTLKAIAISGSDSSGIVEQEYATSQEDLDRTRLMGREGINVLPPDEEIVDHLSFDEEGEFAQETTTPFQDLDLKTSTRNRRGEPIPGRTTIDFINFEDLLVFAPAPKVSYLNNQDFNPKADYIIIDGSEGNQDQVVRVINRPMGTMDLVSKIDSSNPSSYQLVSSNFVRHMINPRTGKITFYYRDSRENRWLKSTQTVEVRTLKLGPNDAGPPSSYVFRWVEDRVQSRLY